MSKVKPAEILDDSESLFSHCLTLANALAYLRLGLLTVGWVMLELSSPEIFFAHYVSQMLIGFFELAFLASDHDAELHKQLRNVMDTIAFAVLLFSVVKSAHQTIEDPQIVNKITLLHFLVFMIDFVSAWFKSYSIYLAGERKHQATNAFENLVTAVWDNRFGRIVAGLLAEGFFLYEFIDLNIGTFLQLASLQDLKNATEEGDTRLTDIKDLKDLMQWHGC